MDDCGLDIGRSPDAGNMPADEELADEFAEVFNVTAGTPAEVSKKTIAQSTGKITVNRISEMVMYFPTVQLLLPSYRGKSRKLLCC